MYDLTIKYGKDSKVGEVQLDLTIFDSDGGDSGRRLIFKKKDGEKPEFKDETVSVENKILTFVS